MRMGLAAISMTLGLLTWLCGAQAAGPGQACGGLFPIPCDAGLYCEFPAGQCGGFDMQGVCRSKPRFCIRIFRPVCGCNGQTFGNDCDRRAAGVSLAHRGKC